MLKYLLTRFHFFFLFSISFLISCGDNVEPYKNQLFLVKEKNTFSLEKNSRLTSYFQSFDATKIQNVAEKKQENYKKGFLQILIESPQFFFNLKGERRLTELKGSFIEEIGSKCHSSLNQKTPVFELSLDLQKGLFVFDLSNNSTLCSLQINSLTLDKIEYESDESCLNNVFFWTKEASCLMRAKDPEAFPKSIEIKTLRNLQSYAFETHKNFLEVEFVIKDN